MLRPELFTKFWITFGIICFFLSCIAYLYYEGMPFEYIYKRKTIHVTPWREYLPGAFKYWAIVIPPTLLFYFLALIFIKQIPFNDTFNYMKVSVVLCFIYMAWMTTGSNRDEIKVRISPEKLIIHYFDLQKRTRVRSYFNMKIYIKDIENIERINFSKFFADNRIRVNRQLDGTYSYVIMCSIDHPERAADGIDITLSNGKHIVFEIDDVENCIRVLKTVAMIY